MSVVSLGSNIASMKAVRKLGDVSAELSATYERLSSGQRINRASDDAAGIAVASSLNADARVYAQALRNVGDGISYLNVADGATKELKNVLFRLRELSTESSNGTFSDTQRGALDKEAQALQSEYNRILDSTTFNGLPVFQNQTLSLQAGLGAQGTISTTLTTSHAVTNIDGTFAARRSFASGTIPYSVAVNDLNGDGKLDMVSANLVGDTVGVLLGNGDGSFQACRSFGTGNQPHAVATADVNGDGKVDLISADSMSGGFSSISVLLGNGDGTFQARSALAEPNAPVFVAAQDVNGDGKVDLISPDAASSTVSIFLGNGDGTFQARSSYSVGGSPQSALAADFNGDGKADLITDSFGGSFSVLLGNGDGTFQPQALFATGGFSTSVATRDFNSDGKLDLVLVNSTNSTLSVLLGNGNGTFGAIQSFASGASPAYVSAADFNADGKADLISADSGSGTVSIFLGNGDGTFQARQSVGVGSWPEWVIPADFNGDGNLDFVTADTGGNTLSVLLGTSTTTIVSGSLSHISRISIATQSSALAAQGQVDSYMNDLDQISGVIGSALSRFEVAGRLVGSTVDVTKAAEARITDADVAFDSAKLLSAKILQQATAAVLAQANQQPALALKLLGR